MSVDNAITDAERFDALFDEYSPRVYAYVRRHGEWTVVDDIVSETFLVAWRRLGDVPEDPLPWLLVVARNTLANQRRTFARHDRVQLETSALERLVSTDRPVDDHVIDRSTMLGALASLNSTEREALLLIAWDGLSATEAAEVAGCSTRTFTVRLHRARRRLARAVDTAGDGTRLPLHFLAEETA
ncbi:MAG: sigma-70 family RNA polymerase sigma factor [Pseudonocardiales bacterium]